MRLARGDTATLVALLLAVFVATLAGAVAVLAPALLVPVALAALVGGLIWAAYSFASREVALTTAWARVLFWALVINLPTFVAFDRTGLTKQGLLNPQSIGRITLFFLVLIGLAALWVLQRQPPRARGEHFAVRRQAIMRALWLPVCLFTWYALDAVIAVRTLTDLLLAQFRVAEWVLTMGLLVLAITGIEGQDESPERMGWTVLRLALPLVFFPTLLNYVVYPLAPSLVFQRSEATGVGRMGALFTHPNVLGTLAACGLVYSAIVWQGGRRWLAMAGMLGLVVLSYSRGAFVALALAVGVLALIRTKSMAARAAMVLAVVAFAGLWLLAGDAIMGILLAVFERGHSMTKLMELSERTIVWSAAQVLIEQSPLFGHGYVAGPKLLAEVMASMSTGSYFVAPHAHNEILQAQVSGGIPAALLTTLILVRHGWLVWQSVGRTSSAFTEVHAAWWVLVLCFAFLQPTLGLPVSLVAGVQLVAYASLASWYARAQLPGQHA